MHKPSDPAEPAAARIAFDDFLAVDIRVGTIVAVDAFPEARNPSFKLRIDFGPAIGEKKSCAQIVGNYTAGELVGTQVAAVINFPPRQIGPAMSEVLVLGFADERGDVVLTIPHSPVPNGARLF